MKCPFKVPTNARLGLTMRERMVLSMWLQGESWVSIGKGFGVSRQRAQQIYQSAWDKLIEAGYVGEGDEEGDGQENT